MNPDGKFLCDKCDRRFLDQKGLRQHQRYSWKCKKVQRRKQMQDEQYKQESAA